MHPYATNSEERTNIPFYVAGIAIGIARLVASFADKTRLPFWVEVPGTATLYGLLLGLFRSRFWKLQVLHKTHVVKVPNLEGEWAGYVTSSFDNLAAKLPVTIHIRQNWTHMSIVLRTGKSESHSVLSSVFVGDETLVSYQYENEPRVGAKDTMHAHRGMANLNLSEDGLALTGDYYSGRDRANYGTLVVTKLTRA